jgi:hypothetical protein
MKARLRLLLLSTVALSAACGAPSSFDGLTGGTTEAPELEAPRPLSPLSVTMVATHRPKLRWELFGAESGAIVELARTREFVPGATKSFPAEGRELVVPEDLEPGIWFWRLRARAARGAVGTKASPTWELLVRGPGKRGSSNVPTGGVVDLDGDGLPDLFATGDTDDGAGGLLPGVFVFRGAEGGTFDAEPEQHGVYRDRSLGTTEPASLVGGTDFDGDGYTDLAYAGLDSVEMDGLPAYEVAVEMGGKHTDDEDGFGSVSFPMLPLYPGVIPTLSSGGDVNGDGYGDMLVADDFTALVSFGTHKGLGANMLLASAPPLGFAVSARPLHGGFDLNGDGLADLVVAPSVPAELTRTEEATTSRVAQDSLDHGQPSDRTAIFALGTGDLDIGRPRELTLAQVTDVRARVFASGDFDGDGLADVASTVPIGGATSVCVWYGDRDRGVVPGPCAAGLEGDTAFGGSLATGDLEGDGTDEIIATVRRAGRSEVRAIHAGERALAAEVTPLGAAGYGTRVTTIWPGRPGKARWAAVADTGASIGVFEGGERIHAISPPRYVRDGFGRSIR